MYKHMHYSPNNSGDNSISDLQYSKGKGNRWTPIKILAKKKYCTVHCKTKSLVKALYPQQGTGRLGNTLGYIIKHHVKIKVRIKKDNSNQHFAPLLCWSNLCVTGSHCTVYRRVNKTMKENSSTFFSRQTWTISTVPLLSELNTVIHKSHTSLI